MKRRQAAGVLGSGREDLIALAPVDGGHPEVHAVGGVLGEGDVVGAGPDEAGGGLPGAGVGSGLAQKEARALEVSRARAQLICLSRGLDDVVGGRPAGAGVQVGVVVSGEGGERVSGQARIDDRGSFRDRTYRLV